MNQKLLTYLGNVLQLEKDKYICEETLDTMGRELYYEKQRNVTLPYPKEPMLNEPVYRQPILTPLPKEPEEQFSLIPVIIGSAGVAFIPSVVVGVIVYGILFGAKLGYESLWAYMSWIPWWFASIVILTLLIAKVCKSECIEWEKTCEQINQENTQKSNDAQAKHQEQSAVAKAKYGKQMEIHRAECKRIDQENAAKKEEQALKIKKITETIKSLQDQRDGIEKTLETVYAQNIIHPDYRALVPVAMFHSYIEKERCETLGGSDGAYNKYEEELRAERIISKLDTIVSRLDGIRDSMGTLYSALKSANTMIAALCDGVDRQAEMQRLNAQVIADQNAALSHIADQNAALTNLGEDTLYELKRTNRNLIGY